jgi:CDP-diacylglycerol--glycerol-3-phosphate 3-phosphatidyltransferase
LKKEILYISNLISLSRFVLLIICVLFLLNSNYLYGLIFLLLIWLSDLLDGYFARKLNQISELGKIIDPIADKVTVITIVLILLFKNIIPLWFIIIVISRDILILLGGLYLKVKKNIVLQSNIIGKVTVFFIGTALFFAILLKGAKLRQFGDFLFYHNEITELLYIVLLFISIAMSFISVFTYFKQFLKNLTI